MLFDHASPTTVSDKRSIVRQWLSIIYFENGQFSEFIRKKCSIFNFQYILEVWPNLSDTPCIIYLHFLKHFLNCPFSGFWLKYLLAFSPIVNSSKIINTEPAAKDNLTCLHGLRVFSLGWVVMVHTYLQVFSIAGNITWFANIFNLGLINRYL